MSIEITRAGMLTTVVDAGRLGHRASGVGTGGALDRHAYRGGNAMLGNDTRAASLEITYGGFACRFATATRFALSGADCDAHLDGLPVANWNAHDAPGGSTLVLTAPSAGVRSYLAIRGGFDVPLVLDSRTTDLRGGFGGWCGRPLKNGDVLPAGAPPAASEAAVEAQAPYAETLVVRAHAYDAPEAFFERTWTVSHDSNRMACRLHGEPLSGGGEIDSHAVFPGVVQLPRAGEPIVLLADAQTTGGYAAIAVVLEADLDAFAQLRAGATVRFVEVPADAD